MSSSLNPNLVNYGYQGSYSEEVEEFDLNYNEFFFRTYDPQIGRWTTQDPYDEFPSLYEGMGNDPINNIDPSGGFIFPPSFFAAIASKTLPEVVIRTGASAVALAASSATSATIATVAKVVGTAVAITGTASIHAPEINNPIQVFQQPTLDAMFNSSTYANGFDASIELDDPAADNDDGCCEGLKKALIKTKDILLETGDQVMASASGVVWGYLNSTTGGLTSTDPGNVRPALSTNTQGFWDGGINAGRALSYFNYMTLLTSRLPKLRVAPIKGKPVTAPAPPIVIPPVPIIRPPSTPNQNETKPDNTQQIKGERGQAGKADGTSNPFKKLKPDPNKPGNVLEKNSHTGKTVSKPAPPGFWEWWNSKK